MTRDMERQTGPVETLCKEIGYRFDRRMETTEVLVAFVRVLVSHIAMMRDLSARLVGIVKDSAPSAESEIVLGKTLAMLSLTTEAELKASCAELHSYIHQVAPDDAYPCDHLIDMLSSCVSAVRFGLEHPYMTRHAASAAQHVWKHVYGVRLFDKFTPVWENDWARAQMQEAILLLATESRALKEGE